LVVIGLCSAVVSMLALRLAGPAAALIASGLTLVLVGRWRWRTAQLVLQQDGISVRRRHRPEQFAARQVVQVIGDATPPWREIRIDDEVLWVPMAHERSILEWYERPARGNTDL
jgi:hypothetical protein